MEFVEPEVICERFEIARNGAGLRAGRGISLTLAPAAAVEGDDAVALPRKGRRLGFPAFAGAGVGVQEHDRRAGASGVREPELYARKLRVAAGRRRFGRVPARRKTQTRKSQADHPDQSRPPGPNAVHVLLLRRMGEANSETHGPSPR